MAQQGTVFESHGSWYVRWWEKIQQANGSFKWVHPSHRLTSKRDYPRSSRSCLSPKNSWIGEPHGEIAERGDHNRGILRKRLHPGN